jgi:hypothetical protein
MLLLVAQQLVCSRLERVLIGVLVEVAVRPSGLGNRLAADAVSGASAALKFSFGWPTPALLWGFLVGRPSAEIA